MFVPGELHFTDGDNGLMEAWSWTGENGLTGVTGAEAEKLRGVLAGGGGDVRVGGARLLWNIWSGSASLFLETLSGVWGVM